MFTYPQLSLFSYEINVFIYDLHYTKSIVLLPPRLKMTLHRKPHYYLVIFKYIYQAHAGKNVYKPKTNYKAESITCAIL